MPWKDKTVEELRKEFAEAAKVVEGLGPPEFSARMAEFSFGTA